MIDKQGKLFGKINIIDLAVLFLVIFLLGGFLYSQKGTSNVAKPKTVTMKVVCPFVYPDVAQTLNVGDQLVASGSPVPVYIKKIEVKQAISTVISQGNHLVLAQNPFRKDIFLEIEGQTNAVSPGKITLGGQEVRAGKEDYFVKTQKVELEATILKVDVR